MPIPTLLSELFGDAPIPGVIGVVRILLHAIGLLMLRALTLGRYPPRDRPYNRNLVIAFPMVIILLVVTVVFS
jgi:hypothetical protein